MAQKMKFFIKDFFRKCAHLLKKSLMENFIFCAVEDAKVQIFKNSILRLRNENTVAIITIGLCFASSDSSFSYTKSM